MKLIFTRFRIGVISLMVMFPTSSMAEANKNPLKITLDDGAYLVTSPGRLTREDIPMVIGVSAIIGGTALLDRTIQHHLDPFTNTDPSEDTRRLGDYGQFAGPAIGTLFAVHGWATNNSKSKETAFLSYESFVLATAISGGIKFLVGRKRPSEAGVENPFQFKPFSHNSSFPSGHTTAAFAAATVFAEQYPRWEVVIPSYAVASAVGFSRLYSNQHWASDVVAAAFLGYGVAHTLRKRHRDNGQSEWSFWIDPTGIQIQRTF